MNKVDALQASESTCHEFVTTYKIEKNKEDIVVQKEEFVMKNKEK